MWTHFIRSVSDHGKYGNELKISTMGGHSCVSRQFSVVAMATAVKNYSKDSKKAAFLWFTTGQYIRGLQYGYYKLPCSWSIHAILFRYLRSEYSPLKMATLQMQCPSTIWLKVTVILIHLHSHPKGYFRRYSAGYIKSSHKNEYTPVGIKKYPTGFCMRNRKFDLLSLVWLFQKLTIRGGGGGGGGGVGGWVPTPEGVTHIFQTHTNWTVLSKKLHFYSILLINANIFPLALPVSALVDNML